MSLTLEELKIVREAAANWPVEYNNRIDKEGRVRLSPSAALAQHRGIPEEFRAIAFRELSELLDDEGCPYKEQTPQQVIEKLDKLIAEMEGK